MDHWEQVLDDRIWTEEHLHVLACDESGRRRLTATISSCAEKIDWRHVKCWAFCSPNKGGLWVFFEYLRKERESKRVVRMKDKLEKKPIGMIFFTPSFLPFWFPWIYECWFNWMEEMMKLWWLNGSIVVVVVLFEKWLEKNIETRDFIKMR